MITARVVALTESSVVVVHVLGIRRPRNGYRSEPDHREALQASGLLDAVTQMRSRVVEDAELKLA